MEYLPEEVGICTYKIICLAFKEVLDSTSPVYWPAHRVERG